MTHRYINLDATNVATEHLCCGFSDKKHAAGTDAKRAWLTERFEEGLVFRKLDARAKVFIEYTPGDACWRPIVAPGWMVIHCLWVSGKYAGRGHARELLEFCQADTRKRGLAGIVVATAKRKRPFLGDPKFFAHHGFERVERVGDYELWAWRISGDAPTPRFADAVHAQDAGLSEPLVARYTDQCPYNRHWAAEMVGVLQDEGCRACTEHITTGEEARRVASPLGTFGLEGPNGLVTHHLNTANAVKRMIAKRRE